MKTLQEMENRFKFRVVLNNKIETDITSFELNSDWIDWVFIDWDYFNIKDNNIKLMQYTWFKDKNLKDIFEWDIVLHEGDIWIIVFEDWWFKIHFLDWCSCTGHNWDLKELQIIWNICENNNLLTNNK